MGVTKRNQIGFRISFLSRDSAKRKLCGMTEKRKNKATISRILRAGGRLARSGLQSASPR